MRILKIEFGDLLVPELKRIHVKEYCKRLNVYKKTIDNRLRPLRGMLEEEEYDNEDFVNPISDWVFRKRVVGVPKPKADPFTPEEQELLYKECKDDRNLAYIKAAIWSGMRPAEQIALTWEDLSEKYINIDKAFTEGVLDTPKTYSGTRRINRQARFNEAIKLITPWTRLKPHGHIFENPHTEEPWKDVDSIYKMIRKVIQCSDVRYRRPYQTRHTFASMLLSTGKEPLYVSSQMGHKDPAIMFKHYTKWIELGKRDKFVTNIV